MKTNHNASTLTTLTRELLGLARCAAARGPLAVIQGLGVWLLALELSLPVQASPGELRWRFTTQDGLTGCPAIGVDGTIHVGSWDRKVYAVNGATGQKKWEFLTPLM